MELLQRKYRLLAVDLDGTLLNSEEEISGTNLNAISQAKEAGVIVVITTGRSASSAMGFIQKLNSSDPCITYNGAVITNGEEILRTLTLDEGLVEELLLALRELKQHPILYTADDLRHYEDLGDQAANFFKFSRGFEDKIVRVPGLLQHRWKEIIRVSIFTGESVTAMLDREFSRRFGARVKTTRTYFPGWDFWIYEILNHHSTKSDGLSYLCNIYGIAREEVIAIGDNMNDLDMLAWAGLGVAMRNALPGVLERADYVTSKSNDEDGVAEVIEKFILKANFEFSS